MKFVDVNLGGGNINRNGRSSSNGAPQFASSEEREKREELELPDKQAVGSGGRNTK